MNHAVMADLASSVPTADKIDRLAGFAQGIGAVHDRLDFAGLDQLRNGEQVVELWRQEVWPKPMAGQPSQRVRADHTTPAGEPVIAEATAVRHERSRRRQEPPDELVPDRHVDDRWHSRRVPSGTTAGGSGAHMLGRRRAG